jgi:hypothetical protein
MLKNLRKLNRRNKIMLKKETQCKDMNRNKIQTSKSSPEMLHFSSKVASAESGTKVCIIYSEIFNEDWTQCVSCGVQVHENCADTEGNMLYYKCDSCKRR